MNMNELKASLLAAADVEYVKMRSNIEPNTAPVCITSYDWREAFGCAGSDETNVSRDVVRVLGERGYPRPFGRSDVAFVVLSVIQRSPEARTEVDPYGEGVACIGNAFERPMDRQLLTMAPGARIRFRRFGRGGHYGRWYVVEWNGSDLMAGEEEASEAP